MSHLATRTKYRLPRRKGAIRRSQAETLSPQQKLVLEHLQSKDSQGYSRGITQVEAIFMYRVHCLHKRIGELKELGYLIEAESRTDRTGHRYTRYYLMGAK